MPYTTIEHALAYYDAGLNILPLKAESKSPALKEWKHLQKRRLSRKEIEEYYTKFPTAGIGIICGVISNLTVVDFDTKKFPADQLEDFKKAFTKQFQSPLMVRTGTGGIHAYFKYHPKSLNSVGSSIGVFSLDIRTEAGYVVAPPSVHDKTRELYSFLNVEDLDLELLPHILDSLPEVPPMLERFFGDGHQKPRTGEEWTELITKTLDGGRNKAAVALIGKLLNGLSSKDWTSIAWPLVFAWNRQNVLPPLPDHELERAFNSIASTCYEERIAKKQIKPIV